MTGDLTAALTAAAARAVAAGELPGDGGLGRHPGLAVGTWRPVPSEAGGGPGRYATTLPFVLARRLAADPARIAAVLAEALRLTPADAGIRDIRVTGDGFLSLTVTADTLAWLAVRIAEAGPGCAQSVGLQGVRVTAPRDAELARAPDWTDAREDTVRFAVSRLASGVPRPSGPDLDPGTLAAQRLGNPAYAVRYAHAHAASALRQAADLGL